MIVLNGDIVLSVNLLAVFVKHVKALWIASAVLRYTNASQNGLWCQYCCIIIDYLKKVSVTYEFLIEDSTVIKVMTDEKRINSGYCDSCFYFINASLR